MPQHECFICGTSHQLPAFGLYIASVMEWANFALLCVVCHQVNEFHVPSCDLVGVVFGDLLADLGQSCAHRSLPL